MAAPELIGGKDVGRILVWGWVVQRLLEAVCLARFWILCFPGWLAGLMARGERAGSSLLSVLQLEKGRP